ncbi:BON domain-containing protein [Acidimangrovimonas sediminis]|uniref:BON domain-containing protein n=1 Tax=Acidimangrovimonas sediminis TaxID=2056283 RepID=UPI000C7FE4DD|nr:BON domain-containing protein [Acidimangrovimonas sediminis]
MNAIYPGVSQDEATDDMDAVIARHAASRLRWNTAVPRDAVRVSVTGGVATLEGVVERAYQKDAAALTLRGLKGLVRVDNRLEVRPG